MVKAILLLSLSVTAYGQNIDILSSGSKASLRGITVVDSRTIWVGGDKGTVLRSTDGGTTWANVSPPSADDLDFRDVEAFDGNVAYAMASGPGTKSRIFKTTDAGKTWRQQFITFDPKNFFDCFAFWNRDHGIAIGDPIGRHFELLETHDGGEHWTMITSLPEIMPNEAAYATGSCIVTAGKDDVWFGTGSKQGSRVFHSADHGRTWSAVATPLNADVPGTGIFSMAFADSQTGIIVGGNYLKPEEVRVNAATTSNGGKTWSVTSQQPFGYRCGVAFMPGSGGNTIIATGTNGIDITEDRGAHWRSLSPERYHSVAFSPDGATAFVLGQNGRIARINFKPLATKR